MKKLFLIICSFLAFSSFAFANTEPGNQDWFEVIQIAKADVAHEQEKIADRSSEARFCQATGGTWHKFKGCIREGQRSYFLELAKKKNPGTGGSPPPPPDPPCWLDEEQDAIICPSEDNGNRTV